MKRYFSQRKILWKGKYVKEFLLKYFWEHFRYLMTTSLTSFVVHMPMYIQIYIKRIFVQNNIHTFCTLYMYVSHATFSWNRDFLFTVSILMSVFFVQYNLRHIFIIRANYILLSIITVSKLDFQNWIFCKTFDLNPQNHIPFTQASVAPRYTCSFLRHKATSPMAAGSISHGVTGYSSAHYGPEVDSACNRNEYQGCLLEDKGGRCVVLTTLPHSCADNLEIWKPRLPGDLKACPGLEWANFLYINTIGITSSSGIISIDF
jgi:hypothetical protein